MEDGGTARKVGGELGEDDCTEASGRGSLKETESGRKVIITLQKIRKLDIKFSNREVTCELRVDCKESLCSEKVVNDHTSVIWMIKTK